MDENPLGSLDLYSEIVAKQLDRPNVKSSTISVWSTSPFTGIAEGEVIFENAIRLRIREEIDFDAGLITSYGYEIYRENERLYWYDDFPHPKDRSLASTHPHHKHIPPDIKHHRIPAPGIRFDRPNLPFLLEEIMKISGSSVGE